jgi:DNA-binding response OmpR family regulator
MKILLVDDNEPLLGLLRQYLVRFNHEVIAVTSFTAGLAAARNERLLDAAVVDLLLPDGSGEDLAGQILELHPAVKVVISTGMGYEPSNGLAGRIRVFQKPFLPRDLLHILA